MSGRKPYERPSVRPSTLAERLHAMLWTHCDATRTETGLPANWYGPQGVLRFVAFEVARELDTEKRAALAGKTVGGQLELAPAQSADEGESPVYDETAEYYPDGRVPSGCRNCGKPWDAHRRTELHAYCETGVKA